MESGEGAEPRPVATKRRRLCAGAVPGGIAGRFLHLRGDQERGLYCCHERGCRARLCGARRRSHPRPGLRSRTLRSSQCHRGTCNGAGRDIRHSLFLLRVSYVVRRPAGKTVLGGGATSLGWRHGRDHHPPPGRYGFFGVGPTSARYKARGTADRTRWSFWPGSCSRCLSSSLSREPTNTISFICCSCQ